jgi:hypothetical protein
MLAYGRPKKSVVDLLLEPLATDDKAIQRLDEQRPKRW